jgi:hypothetical protein
MRQVDTSRTPVFDAPRHARGFFEALVADNLDIGRPELIELIFRRGQRRGRPATGTFKTKIVTYGTEVNVNAFYRHSRIKQYLKDGRALRILRSRFSSSRSLSLNEPSPSRARRSRFTHRPSVPSFRPSSRATRTIGLPVSRTIGTAPSLNSRSKLRRSIAGHFLKGDVSTVRGEAQARGRPVNAATGWSRPYRSARRCERCRGPRWRSHGGAGRW